MSSATLRALLAELIDYAGLFPPAALSLTDVHSGYDAYRRSSDAWALGRVVVPAARLAELSGLVAVDTPEPWRVSALIGDDAAHDTEVIRSVNRVGRLVVDTAEVRAASAAVVEETMNALGDFLTVYVEIPAAVEPEQFVAAIGRAGGRAKIRAGGITPDAFPTAARVARFIACCAENHVAFKATAGLHHPVCGTYPLTYAADAPRGPMFGFLNLFLAAGFARKGLAESVLIELLLAQDASSLRFTDDAIQWREHTLAHSDVVATRDSFAIAFGSCSFREPIDDLYRLGLL